MCLQAMNRAKHLFLFGYFTLIFFDVSTALSADRDWTYKAGDTGPDAWYKKHEACGSTRQSPIALWKNDIVVDSSLSNLQLHEYDVELKGLKLENNGHTIKIEIPDSQVAISGGGLSGKYKLIQLHFHWGKNDNEGSEHMIGNKFYPAELHLVHLRENLTLDQALNDSQGLAVLGVFYEHNDETNNTALMPIVTETERVLEAKSSVIMHSPLTLRKLLPLDISNFYTYNGSLTTPPCNEVVVWSIFTQTFTITTSQLEKFRSIKVHNVDENITDESDFGHKMLFNHRLPQPLHGRLVRVRKQLILELPTKSNTSNLINCFANIFIVLIVFTFI